MTTYEHRNGEMMPPTKAGLYWFRGTVSAWLLEPEFHRPIPVIETSGEVMAWNDDRQSFDEIECFSGRWWGPVLPPWGNES